MGSLKSIGNYGDMLLEKLSRTDVITLILVSQLSVESSCHQTGAINDEQQGDLA